ncbi:acyl-CoA dehydrogenase [Streptomyces sp. NPDC088116]|uniref:acyl-CoA dehydrogenase family protein n=1 Tax=Streptomyces sp. NPDC088116 TaxID=3365825 RepID=UPI00380AF6E2
MLNSDTVDSTVDRLARVLFGADFHREHGLWRRLAATKVFRRRPEASSGERLALAYERLRAVNDALDVPLGSYDGPLDEPLDGDGDGARDGRAAGAAGPAVDPRALAALHEWLGPVDPAFTTVAGIHYNLFLGSLLDHGCPGRRDGRAGFGECAGFGACGGHGACDGRDLSDFLTLRRVGTFLCTEVAHGNDAVGVETTATYDRDRDGFVLHTPHAGAQKFMPNTSPAGGPKTGLVAARLLVDGADHGVFLFLTPLTDAVRPLPGVRVRRLPARLGSPVDHCLTSFDRVFVGRDALLGGAQGRLGEDGVFTSELSNRRRRLLASIGRVTPGKLSMSACAVGSARVTLALAVRYGGHRLISGSRGTRRVPVFAHRSHHGPLVGALATVFAMSSLHRMALDVWESRTERNQDEAERLVAVVKGWITWQARTVIVESRERCGAQGLLENNGMTELLAGIEGVITAEGDNVAIYAKAAAEMLFSATTAAGPTAGPTAVSVSESASPSLSEPSVSEPSVLEPSVAASSVPASSVSAAAGGSYGSEGRELSDPRFLGDLLSAIEELWLSRARGRMGRAPHGDPLARWNAASGAALRAVEAHAYRRAAEAFAAAVDAVMSDSPEPSPDRIPGPSPRPFPGRIQEPAAAAARAHDLLRRLQQLFALQWIDRNSGDLLASGLLSPWHLDELPETVERLIAELAGHAPTLVEAFALPEEMLADWPIAGADYADAYDDEDAAWHAVPASPAALAPAPAPAPAPVSASDRTPVPVPQMP